MSLRAEQWAMLGIVTIGLGAVVLLSRAKPRTLDNGTDAGGPPSPLVPSGTILRVPNIIRTPTPGAPGHALLKRGDKVLGRLELGLPAGAVNDAAALKNLQTAGFSNVQIYTAADVHADPSLVTLNDALLSPGAGTRWFWATWNGNGTVASADVILPTEVTLLWYTAQDRSSSPTPRAFAATAGFFAG